MSHLVNMVKMVPPANKSLCCTLLKQTQYLSLSLWPPTVCQTCYAGHVNLMCGWCRRLPHHMPCESFYGRAQIWVWWALYQHCACASGVWIPLYQFWAANSRCWHIANSLRMKNLRWSPETWTERILHFGCSASYSVNRFWDSRTLSFLSPCGRLSSGC